MIKYLQKIHVFWLSLDDMREEHIRLVWDEVIFFCNTFHSKQDISIRQILCNDSTRLSG